MNLRRRIVPAIALSLLAGCAGGHHPIAPGGPDDPEAASAPLPEPSATLAVGEDRPAAPAAAPTQPAAGRDHPAHGETAAPKPAGGHEHAH